MDRMLRLMQVVLLSVNPSAQDGVVPESGTSEAAVSACFGHLKPPCRSCCGF